MLNQAQIGSLVMNPIGIIPEGSVKFVTNWLPVVRVTNLHLFLMVLPIPILTGSPNMIIDNMPASRTTDIPMFLPGPIFTGAPTFYIN